jgi:hypothetical protein
MSVRFSGWLAFGCDGAVLEQSDCELLRLYQCDGDESAFTRLVQRHSGWIFAAARRRLNDDHLADDATQAVFVVLASKADQLIAAKRESLSAVVSCGALHVFAIEALAASRCWARAAG